MELRKSTAKTPFFEVGVSSFLVVATSLAMAAPASFRGAPQLQLQELQESLHETMQAILQGDGGNRTKQAPGKPVRFA